MRFAPDPCNVFGSLKSIRVTVIEEPTYFLRAYLMLLSLPNAPLLDFAKPIPHADQGPGLRKVIPSG